MTLGSAAYFGEYFQKNNIELSILGCYINLSSKNQKFVHKHWQLSNSKLLCLSAYQAKMIATETGSVPVGYTKENFTEEAYQIARNSIIELVAHAENFGVTVAVEAGINHPIYNYQLAKRLIDEVASPNLKIILDCANLMHKENHADQEKVIRGALDNLHGYITALHLKDYIMENGKIRMVPVGKGCLDFRPVLHYIKYERPLMYATLEATPEIYVPEAIEHLQFIYQDC
ncbi:sugar phosphate isomerase/epimerase [Enterococcus faecium]|nr:sugar phosphate isomerase/epimerase [Enterococcus faecium]